MSQTAVPNDFQRFVAAVKCLLNGDNIKEADKWLMKFKKLDAAWAVTVQSMMQVTIPGLSAEDLQQLHFQAATMLKDKIRKHGENLPAPHRLQLRQRLVLLINRFHAHQRRKIVLQLCIGLANLAVIDEDWDNVIVFCASGFKTLAQREVLLIVLKYFPQQLHERDRNTISIARYQSLTKQLHVYSPHVLKLIQQSLQVKGIAQTPVMLRVS